MKISKDPKLKNLKELVWPVALYRSDVWIPKKIDENHIKSVEMWFYHLLLRTSYKHRKTTKHVGRIQNTDADTRDHK